MVFSSWSPGRIFQEKGTCVVFRIAPHRLGLQELKLSTRRICQRILCSQSLYEACEVLVASPSSPPRPNQSSSASGALQQQGPEKEDSDNWCFDRRPINKATWLPIRSFTKKLYFGPSRDENKTKQKILKPCLPPHILFILFWWLMRETGSHTWCNESAVDVSVSLRDTPKTLRYARCWNCTEYVSLLHTLKRVHTSLNTFKSLTRQRPYYWLACQSESE